MPKEKSVSFYMEKELQKYISPEAKNEFLTIWYKYMFDYIPFRSGIMASLIDFPEDKEAQKEFLKTKLTPEQAKEIGLAMIKQDPRNVIHFRAPYSNRQYEGTDFNFTTDMHQLAQAHWAQVAADLHGEEIMKEFIKSINRNNKNNY